MLSSGGFSVGHRVADNVPDPPEAKSKRVAVYETAVKINDEWSWLYAAIDLDNMLILGVNLFGSHRTNPTAAFLHGLSEKHDLSDGPQKHSFWCAHKTRASCEARVSRRWLRLSDFPCSIRIERSA